MTRKQVWTAVDIDNTIIDTRPRLQGIWLELLGRHVSEDDLHSTDHVGIFEKYADDEQKARAQSLQRRFWELLLCESEIGMRLADLDRPIAHAAGVLRQWSLDSSIAYVTGRPDTVRDLTLKQMMEFGYPLQNAILIMYHLEDYAYLKGERSGRTLLQVRTGIFRNLIAEHDVIRVVDDIPGHFGIYRRFGVPERIGIRTSLRFSDEDFNNNGATRVVDSWLELLPAGNVQ